MAIASLQNALSWIQPQGWQLIKPREIHPESNFKPPVREARRILFGNGMVMTCQKLQIRGAERRGKLS